MEEILMAWSTTGALPTFRGDNHLNINAPGVLTYYNTQYRVKITDENGQVSYLSNSKEDTEKLKRIMRILAQADYHVGQKDLKNTTISDSKIFVSGNKVDLPAAREAKVQRTFGKIFPATQNAGAGTWVEFKPDDDDVSDSEEEPANAETDFGPARLIPNTKTKLLYSADSTKASPNTLANKEVFDFSKLDLQDKAKYTAQLQLLQETVQQYLLESIHAKNTSVGLPPIITADNLSPMVCAQIHQHAYDQINNAISEVAKAKKDSELDITVLLSAKELKKTKPKTAEPNKAKSAAKPQPQPAQSNKAANANVGKTFPNTQTTFKLHILTPKQDFHNPVANLAHFDFSAITENSDPEKLKEQFQLLRNEIIKILNYAQSNNLNNIAIPPISTGDVSRELYQYLHGTFRNVAEEICQQFAIQNPTFKLEIFYLATDKEFQKISTHSPATAPRKSKTAAQANEGELFTYTQTTFKRMIIKSGVDYANLVTGDQDRFNFAFFNETSPPEEIKKHMISMQGEVHKILTHAAQKKIKAITIPPLTTGNVSGRVVQYVHSIGYKAIELACREFAEKNPEVKLDITFLTKQEELLKFNNPSPAAKSAADPKILARENILGTEVIIRRKVTPQTSIGPTERRVTNLKFDLSDCKNTNALANRQKELGAAVHHELLTAIRENKKIVLFPRIIRPAVSATLTQDEIQKSLTAIEREVKRMIGVVNKDNPNKIEQIIFET